MGGFLDFVVVCLFFYVLSKSLEYFIGKKEESRRDKKKLGEYS